MNIRLSMALYLPRQTTSTEDIMVKSRDGHIVTMSSPPIQVFLTTIASQASLRKRQGWPVFTAYDKPTSHPHRVYIANLASSQDTLHILRPRFR